MNMLSSSHMVWTEVVMGDLKYVIMDILRIIKCDPSPSKNRRSRSCGETDG